MARLVPTALVQVMFGETLTDEEAVEVADSFVEASEAEWIETVAQVPANTRDFGPMNLPEDPQAMFDERLAEQERPAGEIGDRPDVDIADIAMFIRELRGGSIPDDANITWLGPVEADAATSGANFFPSNFEHVYRALRLVGPGDDIAAANEARRQDISGACCSESGITLIEGMNPDEAAVVAAHEFTHLYDTGVLDASFVGGSELLNPALALREGNATRVMMAYRDARALTFDPENRPHLQMDMPIALRRTLQFAYADGQIFAEEVAAAGGEDAIDRAFTVDPPQSTEEILHPDQYLVGDLPATVEAPPAPPSVDIEQRGTLGAFVVALVAEDELGWDGAVELVAAWSGDSFIAWTDEGQPCVAARVLFDDAESAATFAEAVDGEATDSAVTIERCARAGN